MDELQLLAHIRKLERRLERMELQGRDHWHYLSTAITATAYEGTLWSSGIYSIDIPANYSGVPANIRAAMLQLLVIESGAAPLTAHGIFIGSMYYTYGPLVALSYGGNAQGRALGQIYFPDHNGLASFRVAASGTNTMTVYVRVWGWLL